MTLWTKSAAAVLVLTLSSEIVVTLAQYTQAEMECHEIANDVFPTRCDFTAATVSQRPSGWKCTVGCAEVLLPFLDKCSTCAEVPGQGQDRDLKIL